MKNSIKLLLILLLSNYFTVFAQVSIDTSKVYSSTDTNIVRPELPDLRKAIIGKLMYPKDAVKNNIEGQVILEFVVEKNGSISDLKVVQSVYKSLDEEALRVVSLTNGKWKPGKSEDISIRYLKKIPINFVLPK